MHEIEQAYEALETGRPAKAQAYALLAIAELLKEILEDARG